MDDDAGAGAGAGAGAQEPAARKHAHTSIISDPDQAIAGELADDESNKRTGPKSKRKHQLGVRRAPGAAHADEAPDAGGAGDEADRARAATRIQRVYRGHQGRNVYFGVLGSELCASEARASAALVIQCAFRCFQARNQYYDLLGTGDGFARAPSYEGSGVPDAVFDKYFRVIEGHVSSVELALREAAGKADGSGAGRTDEDRSLAALRAENAQLQAKLAEANDFLKSVSGGASSSLETQTLKLQLEMKDEEIEEMQEELKDKLGELARVKQELQRCQSSKKEEEELERGLNAPLGAAQESCDGLEETLGTLIGAVSAALDSRHQTHMQVGNLQALAHSLQEKNESLMYENQHLRTKAAELEKNQEAKMAASEAEVEELTATVATLKADKEALVEQLHDANGELTARSREVDRLQEELNGSQHNLLAAQKCADELQAQLDGCNNELLGLNERMKQLHEAGQTLESDKAAADVATKTLTDQLEAEQARVALLKEESSSMQVILAKAQESVAAKENELDALQCEREGQDAIQDRIIGDLLRHMGTLTVALSALETQLLRNQSAQHVIAEEHTQGLAQALDTAAAAAATLASLKQQHHLQQAQFAGAKQQVDNLTQALRAAAARDELTANLSAQVDALTADASALRNALAETKAAHESETAQLEAKLAEEKSVRQEEGKAEQQSRELQERVKVLEAEVAATKNGADEETWRLKTLLDTVQAEKDAMLEEMIHANSQATKIIAGLEEAELLQCRTLKSVKYSLKNLMGAHDAQARMPTNESMRIQLLLPLPQLLPRLLWLFCVAAAPANLLNLNTGDQVQTIARGCKLYSEFRARAKGIVDPGKGEARVRGGDAKAARAGCVLGTTGRGSQTGEK